MKTKYRDYINDIELSPEAAYGHCKQECDKMILKFPELKLVRGHFDCVEWGNRPHWWLVDTENDEIIDPTVNQFPSYTLFSHEVLTTFYEPWIEGREEPTGKCMNCGEYVYGDNNACSVSCAAKLTTYYGCTFEYTPRHKEEENLSLAEEEVLDE